MSPIYEEEGRVTREDLLDLSKWNQCKECGGRLDVFIDFTTTPHKAFLACADWRRTGHEGIEREASRYEKEGLASLNLPTRREIMEQDYGKAATKALDKYIGPVAITKRIATEIVETLWGNAPPIEKTKCILLCQTYQLNPLMKHIYLIGYKRKENGKVVVDGMGKPILDWSIQMGIGATRLLAQRKHNFSYLDMTPRKATRDEIEKILGDTADPNCVYGFVHIKDVDTGAEAFGLRGIEKNANIKGAEKGNTHLNQACVRAERLALDRQCPGEMPPNVEVVDEKYMETPDTGRVNTSTGEIIEGEVRELEPEDTPSLAHQPKEHWCEEHNCAFELKKSRFGSFYAHKKSDGGWCNEKKKKEAAPKKAAPHIPEDVGVLPSDEPGPEAVEESQQLGRDPETIRTLNDLYKACNEDFKNAEGVGMQPNDVVKALGYSSQTDISDTPAVCYQQIAAVK